MSSDHFLAKAIDRFTLQGQTIHGMQSGQAAVELRVPVLHHLGVVNGHLDLPAFVRLISTNSARLAGLYPRKGTLAPGSDADVLIFDPRRRWTVVVDELAMDTDYSCWEGWELQGAVDTVLLRGATVVSGGSIVGAGAARPVPGTRDRPCDRAPGLGMTRRLAGGSRSSPGARQASGRRSRQRSRTREPT